MSKLVAHSVSALGVVGVAQIILVHFCDTGDNGAINKLYFVESNPSRVTIVSVADLDS